jgi:hypothetical protein
MNMPNFFVIGAAKSGTTSVYHYLAQHPQVFMCPRKEPRFFALGDDGKLPDLGPGIHHLWEQAVKDLGAYRSLFDGVHGERAIGEATPLYLSSEGAPRRIYEQVPDAKLIVILRHPVEMSYSAFMMTRRAGFEPIVDYPEAVPLDGDEQTMGWRWRLYVYQALYGRHLRRYLAYFDRQQISVHLYDDLRVDVLGVLKEMFRFLDVDEGFVPDTSVQHNVGLQPRSSVVEKVITGHGPVIRLLWRTIPGGAQQRLRGALERRNRTRVRIPGDLRRRYIEVFRDDILDLQQLLQRDLSFWLR